MLEMSSVVLVVKWPFFLSAWEICNVLVVGDDLYTLA